jgi:hypothetical protein
MRSSAFSALLIAITSSTKVLRSALSSEARTLRRQELWKLRPRRNTRAVGERLEIYAVSLVFVA